MKLRLRAKINSPFGGAASSRMRRCSSVIASRRDAPSLRLTSDQTALPSNGQFIFARTLRIASWLIIGSCVGVISSLKSAVPLANWDFTRGTHGWEGNPRVEPLISTSQGLIVNCLGPDPWIEGPKVDAPQEGMLRVTVKMKTDADTTAQLFYGTQFHASRASTFYVFNDNQWHEYTFVIPQSTGPGTRFRLDPCHSTGNVVIRSIRIELIQKTKKPVFPAPVSMDQLKPGKTLRAGWLQLDHDPNVWNGIRVRYDGRDLAGGYDGELIGLLVGKKVEYVKLKEGKIELENLSPTYLRVTTVVEDNRGGNWTVVRNFKSNHSQESIEITTSISVDQDRQAVLLPWFTLLPGHGSYGARKHQGLFAGLEYLSDEPSSSEADITGPDHIRRIPDQIKITFPLMAIEEQGYYVGLIWEKSPLVAAGFDSPDREFNSASHAMWLSGPTVGALRFANDSVAHTPLFLQANSPLTVKAMIIGGRNPSVLGAVRHYFSIRELPALPDVEGGFNASVDLLVHGWLDSSINENWRFKHAVWMGLFGPQNAAGPAMFMSWLRNKTLNSNLKERLKLGTERTLERVSSRDPFATAVSHVRLPTPPLIFGKIPDYIKKRKNEALAQLGRFDDQGRISYRPGKVDYSKTHFEKHANGIGGRNIADILEATLLCADEQLIHKALEILDQQTALYANSVPRGAQTWEVPLHTPDILASAHMTRAYVYGYVLTGNETYLDQAKYWAWSGVPFIYLENPTEGECGPYSTIAVFGATNWVAPVWLGRPVQWCGLVYCSALHLLSQYDPDGPWKQLGKGITLAGLQMTWPTSDQARQGLLPDFFHLANQSRDGPAINPGTLGAHLPEAFDQGKLYDFHRFSNGWIVHAPCSITGILEKDGQIRFDLPGWGNQPYHILFAGVKNKPVEIRSGDVPIQIKHDSEQNLLIASLKGATTIAIQTMTNTRFRNIVWWYLIGDGDIYNSP